MVSPCRGIDYSCTCRTGEATLAGELVAALDPDMLILADRGFTAHPLFSAMAGSGAQLCWRARANAVFPVLERYPDGPYRSELVASPDQRSRRDVLTVRVIEYPVEDPGRPQVEAVTYRLVTTILDPQLAPASELAALYSERWEFESALDELKTHQRGPRVVLRSKLADGVYQEAWGMLCVHYAIRALLCQAAHRSDGDPDRVSFTRTMRAARRSPRRSAGTPVRLAAAVFHATTEILQELLPQCRFRANLRVVRRKLPSFGVKRSEHRLWPLPTPPIIQAIRILSLP
ncbi:MAG: transposase [Candidatus Dormibacteria bacterium]